MRKVTRTVVKAIIRYKVSGEQKVMIVDDIGKGTLDLVGSVADNGTIEFGYAPLLYSMPEDVFMEKACMPTDPAACRLYSSKDDCPKTADRKVGGSDNS